MQYTASRLSEGNKIFPAHITITGHGVTLKVPGFFGGKEQTIPFDRISAVDIETPFVGYSTIKIHSVGWDTIVASGFTKADVKEMKETILNGQKNSNNPLPQSNSNYSLELENVKQQTNNSEAKIDSIKWSEELRELKELLDDDVINEDDYEEQKLKIMGAISLEGNIKLSSALRAIKDLQDDDIISEAEFNILKQNLMKK